MSTSCVLVMLYVLVGLSFTPVDAFRAETAAYGPLGKACFLVSWLALWPATLVSLFVNPKPRA